MSDVRVLFCTDFKTETKEQTKWLSELLRDAREFIEEEDLAEEDLPEEFRKLLEEYEEENCDDLSNATLCRWHCSEYVDLHKATFKFSSMGDATPDLLALIIQAFFVKFDLNWCFGFEIAYLAAPMKLDGTGGGVVFVTKDKVEYFYTHDLLESLREKQFEKMRIGDENAV